MVLRILKALYRSGWEFWLPLPIIALLFWIVGNAIATQVLTRPYLSEDRLQADTQSVTDSQATILAINVAIDQRGEMTAVYVRTNGLTPREVKYEFPIVEVAQIEAAIAQELGVTTEAVRRLASYRVRE
ncbi:hypothetical protein [Leptolyngbya ohadii]|uniref:hypothetical protein n=1 Tax=Leptolyngbya ohadii TaxID=1962290 RepID=UPI000B59C3FC|nr:hypothetical protein [Leptolyngbya ohadii]